MDVYGGRSYSHCKAYFSCLAPFSYISIHFTEYPNNPDSTITIDDEMGSYEFSQPQFYRMKDKIPKWYFQSNWIRIEYTRLTKIIYIYRL